MMKDAFESKFLLGSALILLAAIIVAYALLARNGAPAPQATLAPGSAYGSARAAQQAGVAPLSQAQLSSARQQGKPANLIGTAESVSGAGISVRVSSQGQEKPTVMLVSINDATEIYAQGAKKSDSEYQKEMLAFTAGIEAATDAEANYIAPDQFEHVPLSVSDIHAGDALLVMPVADPVNDTVTAVKIEKFSQAAQPAAAKP